MPAPQALNTEPKIPTGRPIPVAGSELRDLRHRLPVDTTIEPDLQSQMQGRITACQLEAKGILVMKKPNLTSDRDVADLILDRAIAVMNDRNIPLDIVVDRLTTFAAGSHVQMVGRSLAAKCFRDYADRIEGGLFAASEPKGRMQH